MNNDLLFRTAWFTPGINGRWGLPIFNISEPGTSKSSQVESIGEALGLNVFTFIGSIHEPVDMSGMPSVVGGKFLYLPPEWAVKLNGPNNDGAGLLHLDELTTCQPAVQAAMLRVMLNGAIGEYQLNPRIRIIASMNPPESAANGYDLSPPMANRGAHVKFNAPTASQWAQWLLSGGEARQPIDAAALEKEVLEHFPAHFATSKGLVTAFLSVSPGALHRFPKEPTQQSGAWASARTWEMATRALAGGKLHGMSQADIETLVEGFIGKGTATEFFEFAAKQDLPPTADLLEGRVSFKHDPNRLDKTTTVLASCAALVLETFKSDAKKSKAYAAATWTLMQRIVEAGATDLVVTAAMTISNYDNTLSEMSEADPVLLVLQPVLAAEAKKKQARQAAQKR